jgi:hypothetical protein
VQVVENKKTSGRMGTPAFPNLGQHCSVSDCQQIDFLPFSCDACNKVIYFIPLASFHGQNGVHSTHKS